MPPRLPIRKILVPTDFSACADQALEYGLGLARTLGASIELCHCAPAPDYHVPALVSPAMRVAATDLVAQLAQMQHAAQQELQQRVERHRGEGVPLSWCTLEGVPDESICQHARQSGCDLIVLGSHGRRGLSRVLLGSIAERVVRFAPCPVLVVHPS
ncbi:MAG: universal stress protein [Myxococcales bacterium]|nr:universal stress protein [Myxococcota bacterium]MDW8280566.1 universal stress protein [Myxococcales bacterium]